MAKAFDWSLELPDELPIAEVTKCAFISLGESVTRSAEDHFCSECTHTFKQTADIITSNDPAALIDVDENCNMPALTREHTDLAVQDAVQARLNTETAMDIDRSTSPDEETPLKLVVLDDVLMSPTHCAYENCSQDLAQPQRGVFVFNMKSCVAIYVVSVIVITSKLILARHVLNTKTAGISMLFGMGVNHYLKYVGWSDAQRKNK